MVSTYIDKEADRLHQSRLTRQTLHSPSWLKFMCHNGRGVFLADRKLFSKKHQACINIARYYVVEFSTDDASVEDCAQCGEPLAAFVQQPDFYRLIFYGDDLEWASADYKRAAARIEAAE